MFGLQKNFSKLTVSGNYSASDTEITISGTNLAAQIPNSGSGIFSVIWYDHANYPAVYNDPNREICRVTGVNGQNLFLERGREYTNVSNHSGSTYKMICTPTARGFNNLYYFRNYEKSYFTFEDFQFPAANTEGWVRSISSQTQSNFSALTNPKVIGGIQVNGITGVGRLSYLYNTDGYLFGSGSLTIFESLFYLGAINTGSNPGGYILGFHDTQTNIDCTDGIAFFLTGVNYQARITNNVTQTNFDSNIAITTGWHKYNIVIDDTISNFYVDDNLLISATGLLPTGNARGTSLNFMYSRPSADAEAPIMTGILDYYLVYREFQASDINYAPTGYNFRL